MSEEPSSAKLPNEESDRKLLDQLLVESKLYYQSKDYKDLLDFVASLPQFAPFNAMLLQIQKPGLSFAASAKDWKERFGRKIKEDARPLIILWPFGPVALVYDVLDTEGKDIPEDAFVFFAKGDIDQSRINLFINILKKIGVNVIMVDKGDNEAGLIQVIKRSQDKKKKSEYKLKINKNHEIPVQFSTLVHELGHLYLGHLGIDPFLKISQPSHGSHKEKELEAESVSYVICSRNGILSKSHSYLAQYVKENTTIEDIDVYRVMRASGQIEHLLGLSSQTRFS